MSSTPDPVMVNEIKELVVKAKISALRAWELGQKLNKLFVENCQKKNKEFRELLKAHKIELGLDTAKKYIKLFNTIKKKEDISEHMIVSQLYPLLDVPKQLSEVVVAVLEIIKKHRELTYEDVNCLVNFVKLTKDLTIDKIEIEANKIINERKERKNRKKSIPHPDQKGKKIESDYFPGLLEFFPNKPIDEQGLVGLFCSMFPFLRDEKFQMHKDTIRFDKIQYIRTQFSDALIEAENVNKGRFMQIHTEFEYQSKNFFTHKHNEVTNKQCNLIVCWEDNLNSNHKDIPLVLSIKNVLQEGKIELINHNET